MRFSPKEYATTLYEALSQVSPEGHDQVLDNFARILQENEDLVHAESIFTAFEEISKQKDPGGQTHAHTAHEDMLDEHSWDNLNKLAHTKLSRDTTVDQDLVGGVVLQVGDKELDLSLKTKLQDLQKHLTR